MSLKYKTAQKEYTSVVSMEYCLHCPFLLPIIMHVNCSSNYDSNLVHILCTWYPLTSSLQDVCAKSMRSKSVSCNLSKLPHQQFCGQDNEYLRCSKGKMLVPRYQWFVQGLKVPLKVVGESEWICCKTEVVRITSQISVGIAPPYLTSFPTEYWALPNLPGALWSKSMICCTCVKMVFVGKPGCIQYWYTVCDI